MKLLARAALIATLLAPAVTATAQMAPPFGTEEDTAFAQQLWGAMEEMNFAGDNPIHTFPYEGTDPHGMMLETFYTSATLNGHTGDLIIKRNYGPAGVSVDEVLQNPEGHLGAITVMFRREAGYDEDNQDWFWAKFLPDGTLDKNAMGMELAGRVAKGMDAGCIACHSAAGGDDYLFTTDHITAMMSE